VTGCEPAGESALAEVGEREKLVQVTGVSSSVMVPTPWASQIVAPDALVRSTENVSLASIVGPVHRHAHRLRRDPGAKVRVPEAAT